MKLLAASGALLTLPFLLLTLMVATPPRSGATSATSGCGIQAPAATTGKLSAAQVANYAAAAGWTGPDLVIATALTMPESGADPSVVQKGQPLATTGWGLWQITPGDASLLDPNANARAAFKKYSNAHGFTPWTTYTNGAYRQYISWAQQGVQAFAAGAGVTRGCVTAAAGAPGSQGPVQVPVISGPVGMIRPTDLTPIFGQFWPSVGDPGQCVQWASMNHPGVTWNGNAIDWWANAQAKGATETQQPSVGAIAVYSDRGGYSVYGHVAVVIAVGSGQFTVSEMNLIGINRTDERINVWPDSHVVGFIL